MIPRHDVEIWRDVPFEKLIYPSPENLEEWSLGRGGYASEPMRLGNWEDAAWRVDEEAKLIQEIDARADSTRQFDELASDLEYEIEGAEVVAPCDIGVASAVYSLCAALCPTVVSCRGHSPNGYEPWADYPVIIFCADEPRARLVCEAAKATGCGLAYDDGVQLLDVWAASVTDMLAFARELLGRRAAFDALPMPAGLALRRARQN